MMLTGGAPPIGFVAFMGDTWLSNSPSDNNLVLHNYGENGVEFVLRQPSLAFGKWIGCSFILVTCVVCLLIQDEIPYGALGIPVSLLLVMLWKLTHTVTEESLLVLASVGLQVKTTFLTGQSVTQFLDMTQVKDIVINEGIRMHQVVCYLSVLLTPSPETNGHGLFPLFMNSMPKVCVLQEIYRGVKRLLVKKNGEVHRYM